MHSTLLLSSVLAATGALASISPNHLQRRQSSVDAACAKPESMQCQRAEESYIDSVCQPGALFGRPDLNAPCNTYELLAARCIYGSNITVADVFGAGYGINGTGPSELSNATQQACVCSGQLFNQLSGCMACQKAHGLHLLTSDREGYLPQSNVEALSSAYCAAGGSATPTEGFATFLYDWVVQTTAPALRSVEAQGSMQARTSTFTDPIGNKTAVSLYFTPSVMGSQAVAQAASSLVTATAGERTVSGQIVATGGSSTMTGSATGTAASGSASASATGSGVGRKECAAAGAVLGLAALVALL